MTDELKPDGVSEENSTGQAAPGGAFRINWPCAGLFFAIALVTAVVTEWRYGLSFGGLFGGFYLNATVGFCIGGFAWWLVATADKRHPRPRICPYFIAAVSLTCALVLFGYYRAGDDPAVPAAAPDGWKTYTSEAHGFSFRHPPAWDVVPSDRPDRLVTVFTDREPADSFCIVGGGTPPGGVPKAEMIDEIITEDWVVSTYRKRYPGVKVTQFRHGRISGYQAVLIEIEYSDAMWEGGPVVMQRHDGFVAFTDDAMRSMGCVAAMDAYGQLHPVFTDIMRSFRIEPR